MQDMPAEVTREAPLYSDFRQRHVTVVALRPGDVLEYKVAARLKNPLIPGQFWLDAGFDRDIIALDEQVQVDIPANRAIKLWVSPRAAAQVKVEGDRRIYTWSAKNLVREEPKPATAKPKADQAEPDIQLTSFSSWDEFGTWFAKIQPIGAPAAEVAAKAAELVRGRPSDREKAEAIYAFVAREIRYIGLEFGIGRFQAHKAETVLANRYGDCKDKHALLAALLQSVGIQAMPVLVHSSRKFHDDVASPAQFNHMMSAVVLGKERVYLDTTPDVAPFGLLLPVLRDKPALVIVPGGLPEKIKTPPDPPFRPTRTMSVEGSVDAAGKIEARVTQTLRGDEELLFRLAFRRAPRDKWKDLAQALSYMSGFGGTVSDVTTSDIEDTKLPFQIEYRYSRDNYLTWEKGAGKMRVALPPPGMPSAGDAAEKRSEPLEVGSPYDVTYRTRLRLPPLVFGKALPEVKLDTPFGDYRSTSTLEGNTVTITRTLSMKARSVPVDRLGEYRKFFQAVAADAEQQVLVSHERIIEKIDVTGDDPANKALVAGVDALRRNDLYGALAKFQEVVKLNPEHPYAWAEMARAHYQQRSYEQAVSEARRQLQVNPKHPDANMLIAAALMMRSDTEGAQAALQRQIEIDPDNQFARMRLADVYRRRKNYKEIPAILEPLWKQGFLDSTIGELLAGAYVRLGSPDKALAVYETLFKTNPDPEALNSAAYNLAESSVHLDRALAWAEQSVARRTAQVKDITLDSLIQDDLDHQAGLVRVWDTLGWVYAKRGDWLKAKEYLEPAWLTEQHAEVADHLVFVYQKLGQAEKANEFKSLAQTARTQLQPSRRDSPPVSSVSTKAVEALQNVRTIRLAGKPSAKGSAMFWVLLSAQGVEDVRFISGEEPLASWTATLKKTKFPAAFPEQSVAKLVRRGALSCYSSCMMVLFEPAQVKAK